MGEERRKVIEAALSECQALWPDAAAERIERAVAEFERSREPTDAEAEAAITVYHGLPKYGIPGQMVAALRAARDVRENTE
jgi:hypothetical protein